jgi:hypothetical protein
MATPATMTCLKKKLLINLFIETVSEHNRLQTLQVEALIRGAGFTLDSEITAARERRDHARFAIAEHQEMHGC